MTTSTDEVSQQVVVVSFRAFRVTSAVLVKVVKGFLNRNQTKIKTPKKETGQQTVRQLIGQGQGATAIEVDSKGVRRFSRVLNKYHVDYAIQRDNSMNPPKYLIFFKAKDTDVIAQAFKEYVRQEERRNHRQDLAKEESKDERNQGQNHEQNHEQNQKNPDHNPEKNPKNPNQEHTHDQAREEDKEKPQTSKEHDQPSQTQNQSYNSDHKSQEDIKNRTKRNSRTERTDPDLRPSLRKKLALIHARKAEEERARSAKGRSQRDKGKELPGRKKVVKTREL